MTRTRVKICGNTSLQDAQLAVDLGADALGFIFAPSPRQVHPRQVQAIVRKLPPWVTKVGVFVNEDPVVINHIASYCGLDAIQLHGDESPEVCSLILRPVIKVFRLRGRTIPKNLRPYQKVVSAIMLDTYTPNLHGGSGKSFSWEVAKIIARRSRLAIIVAGGLTPGNVAQAISITHPFGVDVVSGVESRPGMKDPHKLRDFFEAVQRMDIERK